MNAKVVRFLDHLHKNGLLLEYTQVAKSNPEQVTATLAILTREGRSVGVDVPSLNRLFYPAMIECKGKNLADASIGSMTEHLIDWLKDEGYTLILAKKAIQMWPKRVPQQRQKS
jgi:hypothetical protein